jgi:hypothetical protein
LSIIKHVTLQKIVAHDFRYDPRIIKRPHFDSKLIWVKICDSYDSKNWDIICNLEVVLSYTIPSLLISIHEFIEQAEVVRTKSFLTFICPCIQI